MMIRRTMRHLSMGLLCVLLLAGVVHAGTAMQLVETKVNEILEILRDPAYASEAKKNEQSEKIFTIVGEIFDYRIFSMRTLGQNWRQLTPAQQNEFVQLYSELLRKTYMERVQNYSNETVRFDSEVQLDPKKSEVRTAILTSSGEIPLFYRLYNKDGTWRVYDVLVEGISLVKNYRSQFNDIIRKDSAEELLQKLRDKVVS